MWMVDPGTPTVDDVVSYYETGVEAERLARGEGALELARTKELLARYLEPRSAIADVGGGTGIYADWLAGSGHRVELVEPVRAHVKGARALAGEPPRFGVQLGDARDLPFADGSFDAVLLLGPLYHLGEREHRLSAIREAARVCRSGGLLFAAVICRYAGLFRTLRDGTFESPSVFANVRDEVCDGRRVPEARRTSAFPDAYFHLPEELRDGLTDGGLTVEAVLGIEGPGVLVPDLERRWEIGQVRESLLRAARDAEADPRLIVVSAHLLGVARKP